MSYPSEYPPAGPPGSPGPVPPTAYLPAQPPAPVPAKRGGAMTVVLIIVTVLLFLSTLGMTGLYLLNRQTSNKTIADQRQEIATLKADATTSAQKLAQAEDARDTAQDKADKHEACVAAVRAFFKAVKDENESAGQAAVLEIARSCEGVEIT